MNPERSGNHGAPRAASPDLVVLARWEDFAAWMFAHTGKWPKTHRFTFAQRVQDLVLEILDELTTARYAKKERQSLLLRVNRDLERLRHLLRLAEKIQVMPSRSFAYAMTQIDEVGRMAHGWRSALESRRGEQSIVDDSR